MSKNKGHFCYGCDEYFHDTNPDITEHKDCKGNKSLGVCVDGKECGEFHYYNLRDKSKEELIEVISKLTNNDPFFLVEVVEETEDIQYVMFNKSHEFIHSISFENQPNIKDIEIFINQFEIHYSNCNYLKSKKDLLIHISNLALNQILNGQHKEEVVELYHNIRENIVKILKNNL